MRGHGPSAQGCRPILGSSRDRELDTDSVGSVELPVYVIAGAMVGHYSIRRTPKIVMGIVMIPSEMNGGQLTIKWLSAWRVALLYQGPYPKALDFETQ
jgi:hypothetical protein